MDRRTRTAGPVLAMSALSATVALLVSTGCGPWDSGSSDDASVGERAADQPFTDATRHVHAVADVLTRAGTSHARTAMEMASGGTRLTIHGTGSFDYRRERGELRVTLPDSGQRPVTEIIQPGLLYMKNRGAGVPTDKWVRVDTTSLSDGNLVTAGVTDPLAAAALLRGAGRVSYVGSLELGDTPVRHFRGVSDLANAAKAASQPMRGQLAAAAQGFATKTVPFDAYLDGQGRLRKVRHEFVFDNSEGKGVKVASTTSLYGFGSRVEVRMPGPDDIYTGKVAAPEG